MAVSAFQYLTRPGKGDVAPGFSLPAVDGNAVDLGSFKGKPVLLHFFATWCGPCRDEFPSLNGLYNDYRRRGLAVLAISEDGKDADGAVRRFLSSVHVDFPVLLDGAGSVADEYVSYGVPETIFVDRHGVIASRHAGAIDWKSAGARKAVDSLFE